LDQTENSNKFTIITVNIAHIYMYIYIQLFYFVHVRIVYVLEKILD